jgi:hypothetical protein
LKCAAPSLVGSVIAAVSVSMILRLSRTRNADPKRRGGCAADPLEGLGIAERAERGNLGDDMVIWLVAARGLRRAFPISSSEASGERRKLAVSVGASLREIFGTVRREG